MSASATPHLVHRTAHIRLRLTRRQARRCYRMLRSAGDVWAWLLDANRERHQQGEPAISNYKALCRLLTGEGSFGELATRSGGKGRVPAAQARPNPSRVLQRHVPD